MLSKLCIIMCIAICIIAILVYRLYDLRYISNVIENFENEDKIAFLFLTRNNLKRLDMWKKFLKGNESRYSIYCHAKELTEVKDTLLKTNLIPEHIDTCWGCISVVEAYILLMRNALLNPNNKKFILVSESSVPIVSFDVFYNTIMQNDKSRFGIHKENTSQYRYNQIINPEFPLSDFIKHSGQGCIFNRKHAEMLIESMPKFENWKKQDCVDEHYNGNILRIMDKDFNNNNDSIKTTFDIWQKEDLNLLNDNITQDDLQIQSYILLKKVSNKAINSMRKSGFLLMRKVDENTIIEL